jgi:hypothetical protein
MTGRDAEVVLQRNGIALGVEPALEGAVFEVVAPVPELPLQAYGVS